MIKNGLSIYTFFQYSKGTVSKQNLKFLKNFFKK